MREYSFISIAVKRRRDGAVLERDYQDVIRERALAGWEFVQAILFEHHAEPRLDLIFVREGSKK